ncbi:hypothetical protein ACFLZP_01830 [Patescibacteria group bacterium]
MNDKVFLLESKEQRLQFEKNSLGWCFDFFSRKKRQWHFAAGGKTSIIRGNSFDLSPSQVKLASQSQLSFSGSKKTPGLDGQIVCYPWSGTVTLLDKGWYEFCYLVDLPEPIRLNHFPKTEPQILFSLPTLSVQEEGGYIWKQVLIQNPVQSQEGIQSSDFPGAYFYDPKTETEFMFYLDWGEFNWLSTKNLFGFLGGSCGLKSILKSGADQPIKERFLGFWPQNPHFLGNIFPKGKSTFKFYFRLQHLESPPDQWQALSRLTDFSTLLLSPSSKKPKHSWFLFSKKCLAELSSLKKNQLDFGKFGLGLRAYGQIGDFASPNPADRAELMTQMDLLWPLYFYHRFSADESVADFYHSLLKLVPCFYDIEADFFANWYPLEKQLKHQDLESWYFLENGLVKLGWLCYLSEDKTLTTLFTKFALRIKNLADCLGYLFPLAYDWRQGLVCGDKKNYPALGLFAYGMILASKITGQKVFLNSGRKALKVMRSLPLDLLFHEPQQLSFAALAAYEFYQQDKNKAYLDWAKGFLAQQLRMFYWYTDQQLIEAIGCDSLGMVRSFPAQIYPVVKHNPAFKENVEAILPWLPLLEQEDLCLPLLKLLDAVRKNNFYFFDSVQKIKPASYIPLEALPALSETGTRHTGGGVGHAIYGAGEVFWLALLFEGFLTASDPGIMVISLDWLSFSRCQNLEESRLVIYNPTKTKKDFFLKLGPLLEDNYQLQDQKRILKLTQDRRTRTLTLDKDEFRYVKIQKII